jgi:DNA-binding NarL/FixJ family response regulator
LYNRASKKRENKVQFSAKADMTNIPLSVVVDRSLSILEVVVEYLRDKAEFTNHQIALMLNRSDKTVSTVYMRTKKKRAVRS